MRRRLLALLLAAAGATSADARDAVTAIDACMHRLDPGLDVGYARVAERCPDLAASLAASPAAAWLPRDWNRPHNELSAGSLGELRTLLTRPPPVPAVRPPRVERVAAHLAAIDTTDQRQRGWWARFKDWLREVLARRAGESHEAWIGQWLASMNLPQAVLNTIAWVALAGVVALAVVIVANELRVVGLLGRGQPRSPTPSSGGAPASGAVTLQQVDEASSSQQPRLLLELIMARLRAQQRLPPAGALTVHELTRAARLADEADRGRLGALAAACERLRFAAREVPAAMLAAALARGRELLGSLDAPVMSAGA